MPRLIFENITQQEAYALAQWYEARGEELAEEWLRASYQIPVPVVDWSREGPWVEQVGDDTIVYLRSL